MVVEADGGLEGGVAPLGKEVGFLGLEFGLSGGERGEEEVVAQWVLGGGGGGGVKGCCFDSVWGAVEG